MFVDLQDSNLQPAKIDISLPEISLSDALIKRLQTMLEEEEKSVAKVGKTTTVVRSDKNYVFFPNQWYYLAVLCREYAKALYPYCTFFDDHIRNDTNIKNALASGNYYSPEYTALFGNDLDRERMAKFIVGGDVNAFRPGKALFNKRDGSVFVRSCEDIFGSSVLKKLSVPDASSGYLGDLIYFLVAREDLYHDLETEISAFIQTTKESEQENAIPHLGLCTAKGGSNRIFYGAPGCGKSRRVSDLLKSQKVSKDNIVRVTFHPDYSNVDFVGQILPTIDKDEDGEDIVKYVFNPGAFSLALEKAYNTTDAVYLIIEEINRGNAAAIFGDMFQLLDRVQDDTSPALDESEYPVRNPNMEKYLKEHIQDDEIKRRLDNGIFIPSNLSIWATMNSSDQNVFTLDTAFKRRWSFKQISNDIVADADHEYKNWLVPGTDVTWAVFLTKLNEKILEYKIYNQTNEDKRLGKYFVTKKCLVMPGETDAFRIKASAEEFAYKVLEYIWNDVCKIGREEWFAPEKYKTLEALITAFVHPEENESPLSVFKNIDF